MQNTAESPRVRHRSSYQRPCRGKGEVFRLGGVPATQQPPKLDCDALLLDGSTVHVRPIRPDDGERLVAFHSTLSPESIYLRFFSAHPSLRPDEIHRFTHIDGRDRMALVATVRDRIIGVARYDRVVTTPEEAEVAFVVTDLFQGKGVATLLLEILAAQARTQGITTLRAEVLWQNAPMQEVFRHSGFRSEASCGDGVVEVRMDIRPSDAFWAAVEDRDQSSEVESISHLLCPRSIAVVGAGRTPGTAGHEILRHVINGGFPGPVYPIHPSATEILGRGAFPTVAAVPDEVDLAIVAVPAAAVPTVIEDCAAKAVKAVVLISAGFAEGGEAGRREQEEIVADARAAGMRMLGPNCMGIVNTDPKVSLSATFAPVETTPGRVAFASQSGGLGIAVLAEARRRCMGVSSFVSMGNKADISGNDLLQYWHRDAGTDVILLYLESFGNPRRFARIARRVACDKPIVAVKSGRSDSGRRAASSHTAALATADAAVDALFGQAGVIRVDTLEEMFDAAQVLGSQPVPRGRRVAVVGNAGGPEILAADACEANALVVPELSADTQAVLRTFLPAAASVRNPVDMVASASAEDFERALAVVLADDAIDAIVTVFVPALATGSGEVAAAVSRAARTSDKPIVANFLGMSEPPPELGGYPSVPSFCFPEAAVRALARACDYGDWGRRDAGDVVDFDDIRTDAAGELMTSVLNGSPAGRWLDPAEVVSLLDYYGISTAPLAPVADAVQVAEAAQRIGFPVALKASGPELVHKSDVGGVHLGLRSVEEVKDAYAQMRRQIAGGMNSAIVQAMARPGVETIVGVVNDPSFGPLVMFGSGGTAVELFADRAFRILPLTDADAHRLVRSIRGAPLLFGYRGRPPVDTAALETLLLRVARLASDYPEIAEMDMNPVVCGPWGVLPLDVKIRIAPTAPHWDETVRRLP